MTGSKAVALRTAVTDGLATMFAATAEFNGSTRPEDAVSCSYAFDWSDAASAQQVYTGRSRADTDPAAVLRASRNVRDEKGEFDLNVRVALPGGTAQEADERAFAIGEAIEDWIADRKSGNDPDTGAALVASVNELTVRGWASDYVGSDSGAGTILTLRVGWRARLT